VNRDRVIANPPPPAQLRPIVADEALGTRIDLTSAGKPHVPQAPWLASDSLISSVDARRIFGLGRTAAYSTGLRRPVQVSARCYRWQASMIRPVRLERRPQVRRAPTITRPGRDGPLRARMYQAVAWRPILARTVPQVFHWYQNGPQPLTPTAGMQLR
jgi:hypothetical protein